MLTYALFTLLPGSVFMVMHTAWLFLEEEPELRRRGLLQDLDCLALLLSALCHDLEHPGTTNAFQVNTGSALAIRYNDASVLENHHASVAAGVLSRARVLTPLRPADVKRVRRSMLTAILATDSAFPRYGDFGCCLPALNACAIHSASRSVDA